MAASAVAVLAGAALLRRQPAPVLADQGDASLRDAVADEPQITEAQKRTIEQLTSVFENGTPEFQYSYIEDIGDGAGPTVGRIGFTGGELALLVGRYVVRKNSATPLAAYLSCLEQKGSAIMTDYACLYPSLTRSQMADPQFKARGIAEVDFGKAWAEAGADPVMREIQDAYVEKTYYEQAITEFRDMHLRTALALAFIYDTVVQMDEIHQIERYAQTQFAAKHHGLVAPRTEDEEIEWLRFFQIERARILPKTASGGTAPRVESLNQILDARNTSLTGTIRFSYVDGPVTLDGRE